jgi:hypothetical protein
MYKTRTKKKIKIIIIVCALLWLLGSIFFFRKDVFSSTNWFGELLQWLINISENNEPIDKLFKGDALIQNAYRRSLDSQKQRITQNITQTAEKIQLLSKIYIDPKDITNILYNNTAIYRLMRFSCKECFVPEKEINQSYQRVLKILKNEKILTSSDDNKVNRDKVDNWITSQYFFIADSNDYVQEIKNANQGEDLFMNWIAEDSDYDLQIDIENIGKLLFESFIAPTEIVFYKFPHIKLRPSNNKQLNQELNSTIKWILDFVNTWSKAIGMETVSEDPETQNQEDTKLPETENNETPINPQTITEDRTLQEFKEMTNRQTNNNQLQTIQGDICKPTITSWPQETEEYWEGINPEQATPEAMQKYIEETQKQIENYQNLNPENEIIQKVNNPALQNMTPEQKIIFVEQYTKKLLDDSNVESCLQKCSNLPISDRIICQIKCLCFTMTWPNDPDMRFQSMNEMLKLRFCMVPAKSMEIPKGKNINSLEDIYTRIYTNMYNLIYNGEMVKYQRNKEFLENPIADLKFDKMISFQFNLNSKPIFENQSDIAKKDDQKNDIRTLEQIVGKESPARGKTEKPTETLTLWNDINKYLIIQDPVKKEVYKEYAPSPQAYEQKYFEKMNALQTADQRKIKTIETIHIPVITNKKNEALSNMADFLAYNFSFWQMTELELQNINNVVLLLKSNF